MKEDIYQLFKLKFASNMVDSGENATRPRPYISDIQQITDP
jgi:hypothetical protein